MSGQENNVDRLIKRYLQEKMSNVDGLSSENCPSESELSDYLEDRLSQESRDALLEHIADCPHCLSLLELAQGAKEQASSMPTPTMIKRAKNLAQQETKKKTLVFKYKWAISAGISFALSFILTRYFIQFLTLAVIFSLKWIFDTGSTRTLVMIYQAWRKKDSGTVQRIIQDFQDKTIPRR